MRHPLETSVAVAAAVVGVAFGLSTLDRWFRGRRPHELAWSAALAMFALAAGALGYGAQAGWSGPVFRVFYLFGAIADVPVLALGTVYLLAGRRVGHVAAVGVALVCAFAAGVVVMAPFRTPLPVDQLVQGSKVFGPLARVLAALSSAAGAAFIVAAALWSAWRVRHRPGARRLVWSNGLIAAGTLVLGASGTLNSIFGAMTAFGVTLLVGISVIFAGFLVAAGGSGDGGGSGDRRGDRGPVRGVAPAPAWRPRAPLKPSSPSLAPSQPASPAPPPSEVSA